MTIQEAIKKLWLLRNKYECLTYKEAEKISITNAEFVDAIQIAIEALEKQIPQKPKYVGEVPVCSCGMNLSKEEFPYCRYCGQAISWEGVIQNE